MTAEKEVKTNKDTFEHHVTESAQTYSPDSIAKSADVNSVSATSTTDIATTLEQKKLIPRFLAAKLAHLNYDTNTGSPSINSGYDAQAYQAAWNTIKGDHSKLSYKAEYRYNQNVSGSAYGLTSPQSACAAFAFATALSVKENRKITPDKVKTDGVNEIKQDVLGNGYYKWNSDEGSAYRITASEEDCLLAVDAQLQLGNPAVIHIIGKNYPAKKMMSTGSR